MSRRKLTAIPKEYRPIVKAALGQGWELSFSRHGHPMLSSPDGSFSTPIPSSSRSPAMYTAIKVRLVKAGLAF